MVSDGAVGAELEALHEVTQQLMTAGTEQEICEVAVSAVPDIFDVPIGALWLYDSDAVELQMTAATDWAADFFTEEVVYRPGNSISWEAFDQGEVLTYSSVEDGGGQYDAETSVESEVVLPIGDHGMMNIGSLNENAFDATDIQVARLLATNLEEVVGTISHDLRNPLNVAMGHLEISRREHDDEHLDTVADSLDRMETLIEEVLTLADEGYAVENRTNIDLETLAERAWSNVHAPEATLSVTRSAGLFGDETRVLRLLENLFRNAVQHAGEDVTVEVGAIKTFHTSTRVSATNHSEGFYVQDDGPGIPPEDHEAVFEPGYSTNGTGLGLAIVKRIIEAHGWEISIENRPNTGARFEVTGGSRAVVPFSWQ
ncbi:histidine kinase [Halobacteriales archaeon QH_10_67_22]|nr:MAG: histidine kinase [Halobacteriales archaeon QH_10_67_22]